MGEWISVKDRLPDKAGIYIICDHYGNVMSRHFCKSHGKFAGYWHFNGSEKYGDPTHWMPLPEPPNWDNMNELDKAIKFLREQYERAKRIDAIYNPLAWALYQTWRHVDEPPKEDA